MVILIGSLIKTLKTRMGGLTVRLIWCSTMFDTKPSSHTNTEDYTTVDNQCQSLKYGWFNLVLYSSTIWSTTLSVFVTTGNLFLPRLP